jgi:ribonucleotide reductase class II
MVRVVYRLNGEDKELVVTSDHEFLIYPEVYPKTEETTTRNPIRCKIADLQAHPEYGDRLMGAWGQPMCRVMKVEHLEGEWSAYSCVVPTTHSYDLEDIHTPNCGEIIGCNFLCNLTEIHLNKIAFWDLAQQEEAFTAGGVMAAILLRHQFDDPLFQESRNLDPIVGVSFTGLFDFFVFAFGYEWLQWWQAGRPDAFRLLSGERDLTYVSELPDFGRQPEKWLSEDIADYFNFMERSYLQFWKEAAHKGVAKYCNEADIPCPNRCTTVQPAGTKSLLTGASPGWHPPKGNWFDRSITFSKADPVALACLDAGYKITPGESDKDAHGNLLPDDAIWDEQCQTWLVVIPCQVLWAEVFEGKEVIDPNQFSAVTQFKFAMQVQNWYVTHNTSATVEARKHEAVALATAIYDNIQKDEGYVSTTILSRFEENSSHPRMPFQPLTKERYVERCRETNLKNSPQEFLEFINRHSLGWTEGEGPAGCDSDACLTPALKSQVFAKIEVDL